ncbi:WAP four-disulfide core domain protein 2-like [Trichosurus vulpecula]|uniref:WAP four-disulfide core domain protein 2-like n=1 Tax=Trichosurus vulpecula TaxID=9337 RepID=UPI00186B415C|nr:WAP four-disulfide core domain protein 2-like [Trichosurus vulpecula]
MASKLAPFSAFFGSLFFLSFLGPTPTIGQNDTQKVGVCPEVLESQDCPVECRTDGDCPDVLKCCTVGCTSVCVVPNEKKGKCPINDSSISLLGICKDECYGDSDCSGSLKCCINGCGNHSCLKPGH